ncbi:MAG: YXWGXW repeat-containing protein [Terriglobales bacterium]
MGINRYVRWILLVLTLAVSVSAFAGVFVSVGFGPPALPVYEQPPCPAVGYIWTPGYWGYGPNGYYWVPGTWVMAPQPGLLWTPGYWGWGGSAFMWHAGYWGPVVGFYGGINYGFGYTGAGYHGGYWRDRHFYYNRSVNNVTVVHTTYVYNSRVEVNNVNHVSYNGGRGGLSARPTPVEERAARERHFAPTAMQTRQRTIAAGNRQLWASENHGRPAIAATARPGEFKGKGVVAAREAGAAYKAPEHRGETRPAANHEVPRPGNTPARTANNVPRPGNAGHGETPSRNDTPRPPSASNRAQSPRIENTSRPAVPRPANKPHENMSRPATPRPETAARQPEHRPEAAPRQPTPRPETAARQPERRPEAATRQPEHRPEAAPRAAAPRPQSASRPAPHSNDHRAEEPRRESHPKGRPRR